ncbi:MAG TPA: CHAT domain-containing protein, partial [Candidatus Acidoferrum sp.]|nr:CHAT domain-containing protein [Candidatus Acidoferrum sp.]
ARAALAEAARGASPDAAWPIARHRGIIAESEGSLDEAEGWYREAVTIIERMRASSAPNEVRAPFFEKRWEPFELLFELQLERGNARDAFATFAQAHGRMFLDTFAVSLADARSASPDPVQGAIHRVDVLEQMIPLLARSRLGGRPSPESILAALRDRHVQHLLAYFAGAGRMRLLSVMGGEPRITSVDIELERLDRLIDDFRARPDDGAAAAALGAALLPPDALPATPGRLHVVPTGPLMRVAFAALEVGGERLVERHEIAYLPSVTGLAAMADERGESAGPGVVIADSRSDLRSAARELDAVVARTGATPRTGAEATPEAFRAAATAPLLHVISHSGLDRRGGYLLLGDRKVTAAEILDWRIRPHLAVLPTCASAATVRSEMWDSLAAAFLAAGSAHVVATLASVEDQVAADFTLLFYLHGGLRDPVGATARAQREMARTHRVAAWSAFVAAGL